MQNLKYRDIIWGSKKASKALWVLLSYLRNFINFIKVIFYLKRIVRE